MIPLFPVFKKIESTDREEIIAHTRRYDPYSDFNFTSMWSWDIHHEMGVSILNSNLVVRFNDYITGEAFYSFLGDNKPNETALDLIEHSKKEGLKPVLKLMPQVSVLNLDRTLFECREDRDNFDYILSVDSMLPHDGTERKLSTRRKLINEFKKRKDLEILLIDIRDRELQKTILNVFDRWESQLDMERSDISHLKKALLRLFELKETKRIIALGVYLNKILVGYSINEILPNGYTIGHTQQANQNVFSGIYALMMQEVAEYLVHLEGRYINVEQDLGIEGLRKWKTSYNPVLFLKKYVVIPVDNKLVK